MRSRPTIIVPVKPFAQGKSRLAPVLSPARRADLARRLCTHVLGVVQALRETSDAIVVSRSPEVLSLAAGLGLRGLAEAGDGLNAAVLQAMAACEGKGVLVVCADLPLLSRGDLEAMMATPSHDVVVGTDSGGTGTNALFLARAGRIDPQFGPGSHRAHCAAARAARLSCTSLRIPGIAADLDAPDDLRRLQPLIARPVPFLRNPCPVRSPM